MKRSIFMLVAIAMAVIFAGCEKEEILSPHQEQDAIEESALKGAKAKDKRSFEGVCTPIDFGAGIWKDAIDDWRVTGTSYWYYNEARTAGTATLVVEAKNPHEENCGIWEMDWHFLEEVEQPEVGFLMVAVATGNGIEGKVKGLEAKWTYTFHYTGPMLPGNFPFDITDPSFYYKVKGNIDKPHGPRKHRQGRR